jgi:hypothetical protein
MQLDSRSSTSTGKMSSVYRPLVLVVAVVQGMIFWQGKRRTLALLFKVYGANFEISPHESKHGAFWPNG